MDTSFTCVGCGECLPFSERVRRQHNRCRPCAAKEMARYRQDNPTRHLLYGARRRASKRGLQFDLTLEDISIPELCPILGVPLEMGTRSDKDNAPSLDRVDTSLGYIKGNVKVISHRANRLKGDASLSDLRRLLQYMENH